MRKILLRFENSSDAIFLCKSCAYFFWVSCKIGMVGCGKFEFKRVLAFIDASDIARAAKSFHPKSTRKEL